MHNAAFISSSVRAMASMVSVSVSGTAPRAGVLALELLDRQTAPRAALMRSKKGRRAAASMRSTGARPEVAVQLVAAAVGVDEVDRRRG